MVGLLLKKNELPSIAIISTKAVLKEVHFRITDSFNNTETFFGQSV